MIGVAGPPGSGKSSIFPVSSFGIPYFKADDRAAELNGGSYIGIPKQLRAIVKSRVRGVRANVHRRANEFRD
jgi:hypothetical protein